MNLIVKPLRYCQSPASATVSPRAATLLMNSISATALCFALSLGAVTGAESKIIAPGEALKKLAGDFSFTEGPACDKEGNVLFTDQPNDRIMMWSVDGKLSTYLEPAGRANGLSFDEAGNLWACADGKNELRRSGNWSLYQKGTPGFSAMLEKFENVLSRLVAGESEIRWSRAGSRYVHATADATRFVRELFLQYGDDIADLEVRRTSLEDTYMSMVRDFEGSAR